MSKSDHPLIIGSGTKHSVSVSEHTGNASTPKNKVRSGAEHKSEKIALNNQEEQTGKTTVSVDQKQDEQVNGNLIAKAGVSVSIQTVTKDANTNNNQKIEGKAINDIQENVLKSIDDKTSADGIHNTASPNDQNVKVRTDSIAENVQAIDSVKISENIQPINIGKTADTGPVKLINESAATNKAKLLTAKA